jgi:hypothetical protein
LLDEKGAIVDPCCHIQRPIARLSLSDQSDRIPGKTYFIIGLPLISA